MQIISGYRFHGWLDFIYYWFDDGILYGFLLGKYMGKVKSDFSLQL